MFKLNKKNKLEKDNFNERLAEPIGSKKAVLYPSQNAILADNIFMSLNTEKTLRNNNTLVIGGTQDEFINNYVKPNLLQANASYVVADPTGELYRTTENFLKNKGYLVEVLNLKDIRYGNGYNPFQFLNWTSDEGLCESINLIVNNLVENTNYFQSRINNKTWEAFEKKLLTAILYYLIEFTAPDDQNLSSIMSILEKGLIDGFLDNIFEIEKENYPDSKAIKEYEEFSSCAGDAQKSIIISCILRLAAFGSEKVKTFLNNNEIFLDSQKYALFIIADQDDELNFMVPLLYTQLLSVIKTQRASLIKENKPIEEVRFFFTNFTEMGKISYFETAICLMRKYKVSCSLFVPSILNLKKIYNETDVEIIAKECDTLICFENADETTTIFLKEKLNVCLPKIDSEKCALMVKGYQPVITSKFECSQHPNYSYLKF